MHVATCHLRSLSPYSPSRPHQSDMLNKESHEAYDKRTWREKAHALPNGRVIIPQLAFKNCILDAAEYSPKKLKGQATYTKHFKAGVVVLEPFVLSVQKDALEFEDVYCFSNGKDGSRVWRRFPLIREWSGTVAYHVTDDKIPEDVFTETLTEAGAFIGLGRWRMRNGGLYGRFAVEKVDWK